MTTAKETCINEASREPLYSLVWTGMWIVAMSALLLIPVLGS